MPAPGEAVTDVARLARPIKVIWPRIVKIDKSEQNLDEMRDRIRAEGSQVFEAMRTYQNNYLYTDASKIPSLVARAGKRKPSFRS